MKVIIGVGRWSVGSNCWQWAMDGVIKNIRGRKSNGELVKINNSTPPLFKVGGPNR